MNDNIEYVLAWIAAPRPPVHNEPMKGTARFKSPEDALKRFKSWPDDSRFVSLTKVQTVTTDVSAAFREMLEFSK